MNATQRSTEVDMCMYLPPYNPHDLSHHWHRPSQRPPFEKLFLSFTKQSIHIPNIVSYHLGPQKYAYVTFVRSPESAFIVWDDFL